MNEPLDFYDTSKLNACGEDVRIAANVMIRRPHLMSIGKHVLIDDGFYCTTNAAIGDYAHIAPYVTVIGGADAYFTMKEFSGLAAGCRIICASEELRGAGLVGPAIPPEYHDKVLYKPVVLERFASASTNAVIFPGVTLGEGSIVSAGSVVTKNTDPWGIYVGSPARKIGERPRAKMLQFAREMGY